MSDTENKAKIKARELVELFSPNLPHYTANDNLQKSKQCALILCDHCIELEKEFDSLIESEFANKRIGLTFYEQVKAEVEKL